MIVNAILYLLIHAFFPDGLKGFGEVHYHGGKRVFVESVLYTASNLLCYMGHSAFSLFHSNAS